MLSGPLLMIDRPGKPILGNQFQWIWVPNRWLDVFGDTPIARWAVAIVGGIIMGMGARWAGG